MDTTEEKRDYEIPFTQMPNDFLDEWARILNPETFVIVSIIARKTIGHKSTKDPNKRKIEDWITHSQLKNITGYADRTISNSIKEATYFNLIKIHTNKGVSLQTLEQRKAYRGKVDFIYELTLPFPLPDLSRISPSEIQNLNFTTRISRREFHMVKNTKERDTKENDTKEKNISLSTDKNTSVDRESVSVELPHSDTVLATNEQTTDEPTTVPNHSDQPSVSTTEPTITPKHSEHSTNGYNASLAITDFYELYKELKNGLTYMVSGGKDGSAMKAIIKTFYKDFGRDGIVAMMREYISNNKYVYKNGHNIGEFQQHINMIAEKVKKSLPIKSESSYEPNIHSPDELTQHLLKEIR